jgi:6-phosphogluconate dehydrogenase
MRDLSKYKALRTKASALYKDGTLKITADQTKFIQSLEEALYFSTVLAYAQGMHLLSQASAEYGYALKMDDIALIWRGGCIIRSTFLEDIYQAYKKDNQLPHLLLDAGIAQKVNGVIGGMRQVVSAATAAGIAIPAYTASLSYFDAFRSERMPSNLIQAQRDYFGAHTYELIGKEGVFHTQWFTK